MILGPQKSVAAVAAVAFAEAYCDLSSELQPGGERNWRFWIPSAAGSVRAELTIPVESTLDVTGCHSLSFPFR